MLPLGTRLGHYEVVGPLGTGGMGEVYRARDTRLNRVVAVKILPADLASNAERVRRFEAEARAASALNHPHIVSIFETGTTELASFIAMELVDGVQFDQWIQRQQPDLHRVLAVIAQIADALAAAHRAGIIHRDLKPANLIVTSQGYVKVLDFGLAKMTEPSTLDGETQSAVGPLTQAGAVMGTAPYMSPEQALGRPVDARTDMFSLGSIIYEGVTGCRPFPSTSAVDVLHAIVHDMPPRIREVSSDHPRELEWIVEKALAKNPDERYQTMRDLAVDVRRLQRLLDDRSASRRDESPAVVPGGTSLPRRPAVVAFLVLAMIAAWAVGRFIGRAPAPAVRSAAVTLAPLTSDPGYEGEATFSADGQTIAFVSDRTGNFDIFLRQVAGGPSINLTNNAADDVQPAFSPDGRQIAFVSSRAGTSDVLFGQPNVPLLGGDIWVMPALGGSARRLVEKGNFPSWSPDGTTIVYTAGPWFAQKLYRISAAGGQSTEIPIQLPKTRPLPGQLTYPRYSPDGRWITVIAVPADIYVIKAEGGEVVPVARGSMAVWSPDSRSLIYSNADRGRNYSLWRLAFDPDAGRPVGSSEALTIDRGADLQPAISPDGKLVAFTAMDVSSNIEKIVFDPDSGRLTGDPQPVTFGKDAIYFFTAAPDGRAVAFGLTRGAGTYVWRADADGASAQLTYETRFLDEGPRWSPDGRTIAFIRRPAGDPGAPAGIWTMQADGGNPGPIVGGAGLTGLFAWTHDSRHIVSVSMADRQLHVVDLETKARHRLTDEPAVMPIIVVSQDGRWVVYQSVQTGNIDLRAVPMEGGASRVVAATPHQEYHPSLAPSGRWLYYLRDHKALYRVPGPAQDWRAAEPEKVYDFRLPSGTFVEDPQISQDGRSLLFARGRFAGDIWVAAIGQ